jgi:type VI secretion system protein ImpF
MPTEPTVRHSVLDRLIGGDRKWDGTRPAVWGESLAVLQKALLRDLQALLNTRRTSEPAEKDQEFLRKSLFNYGLPDITMLSADSSETPGHLRRIIEETIELFEPRLSNVHVSLVEDRDSRDRRVQFLIEADLKVEPDTERVEFDTVLEVSSGKFAITSHDASDD